MKAMKNLQRILFATTITGLLFTACKKSSNDTSSNPTNAQLQTQADDQARVSTETDASFDDVNAAMAGEASITGSSANRQLRSGVTTDGGNQDTVSSEVCNAVVTIDTVDNPHTLTITYNGKTRDSLRTRSGSIVISWVPGTHWTTAGDVVTVQFNNLKITRLLDNKSITFNGTHTYTNVTGGSLLSLNSNSTNSITHTITSTNMSITFDDGTQRTWSFARQRTFSYNSGIVVTESGFHSDGTHSDISEWGTNRLGNSFKARIPTPLVVAQSCSWQVTSGVYMLTNSAGTLTLTFGLDSSGAAMTSCPVLPSVYYLQLSWAGTGGKTYTYILPY
jgi:hypothetical protein